MLGREGPGHDKKKLQSERKAGKITDDESQSESGES